MYMLTLVFLVVLATAGTALVWVGSSQLEPAADRLAVYYGLPMIVQGAVVVAIGSSMPELVAAVLAPLLHGDFDLGVAIIIGSAIFNVLVIPALATLLTSGGIDANRALVYKEAQFYLIAVAVFLLMLSMAVIYFPVAGGDIRGQLTPLLALGPLGLYVLYAFIQYQDTIEFEPIRSAEGIQVRRQWARFIGGFLLILIGVEGLLRAAIGFGELLGTPSFIWGLTIVAAATSLPDALVSIRAAQHERDVTSLANVFGSNVFDLLVAAPAGVIVAGAVIVEFGRLAPLVGFLIVATIVLFAVLRTDFELSRREAWVLIALYGVFLGGVFVDSIMGMSVIS